MKIDTDLRLAIRSVITAQKPPNWTEKAKQEEAALSKLLKDKPSLAMKLRTAKRFRKKAEELTDKARKITTSIGLNTEGSRIYDERKFHSAGGRLEIKKAFPRFESVMARIAQASDKDGRKILNELGIKWE